MENNIGTMVVNTSLPTHLAVVVDGVLNKPELPIPENGNKLALDLLTNWFTFSDHLTPIFVDSKDEGWEPNIFVNTTMGLDDRDDGRNNTATHHVELPIDMTFTQAVHAAINIFRHTYSGRPDMLETQRDQLLGHGKMFRLASRYFRQTGNNDVSAQFALVAETLDYKAEDNAIEQTDNRHNTSHRPTTAGESNGPSKCDSLTSKEIIQAERWLLGETTYDRVTTDKKGNKLDNEQLAQKRQHITKLLLKQTTEGDPSFVERLIAKKVVAAIRPNLLQSNPIKVAVYDRGLDMLANNIEEPKGGRLLVEDRHLERLARTLNELRQKNTLSKIAKAETEVVDRLQKLITSYKYEEDTISPSEILATKKMNCLGSTMLASRLLSQLGIEAYAVAMPEHSAMIITRTDGSFLYRDFTSKAAIKDNCILTEDMFEPGNYQKLLALRSTTATQKVSLIKPLFDYLGSQARTFTVGNALHLTYAGAHNNLGASYSDLHKQEEAISCYREAIRLNQRDVNAHNNLGNAYSDLGRYDEAISCYQEAIRLNQGDATAHYNLGNAYVNLGRYDEAISCYQEAIRLNQGDVNAHSNLGVVYALNSQWQEAQEEMRQAGKNVTIKQLYVYTLTKIPEINKKISAYNQGKPPHKQLSKVTQPQPPEI